MKRLLDLYRPVFNAEGGGAAAGGADKGGSNGAAAAADAGAAAAAVPYRPDGMHEQYHGKDDRETIDRLHKAVDGYRQRDAGRDVPEKAEGYMSLDGLKGDFKLDDAVKPYFENLTNDPAAKAMFEAAKAHGMDRGAVLDVWQKGMQAMAAAGILEPLVDEKAERAALLPEAAKGQPQAMQDAAIDARMQQNEDFIKLLGQQKGPDGKPLLDPKVGDYALMMLGDKAEGHQFFEFMRGQMQGIGKDGPLAGGGSGGQGGGMTAESLRERRKLPENTPGDRKFNQASYDALQADYKKVHGE